MELRQYLDLLETASTLLPRDSEVSDVFTLADDILRNHQRVLRGDLVRPRLQRPSSDLLEFAAGMRIHHPSRGLIPFTPYEFQINILRFLEEGGRKIICSSRNMGGTLVTAIHALWLACTRRDQVVLIMSHNSRMATLILDMIKDLIRDATSHLPEITTSTQGHLVLENGSRFLTGAGGAEAARGLGITHVVVDNAAFVSYKLLEDLLQVVEPQLQGGASIILQSSPKWAEGPFYDIWRRSQGQGHNPAYLGMRVVWSDHPDRDQTWADITRSNVGEVEWTLRYMAEFVPPPARS